MTSRAVNSPATSPPTIFTIGHSTRTVAELVGLLRQAAIDVLVDVRSVPRSRTNRQFNADALAAALAADGIGYRHVAALGGLRGPLKNGAPSPNTLWRNEAFRNYADYAATDAFCVGLDELVSFAREGRCAIMCAEALWWRCHRRIIADHLLARDIPVVHIMGPNKVERATMTAGAQRLAGGTLVYPAAGRSP
jgi:uncharacterized protein (DUF488 family)